MNLVATSGSLHPDLSITVEISETLICEYSATIGSESLYFELFNCKLSFSKYPFFSSSNISSSLRLLRCLCHLTSNFFVGPKDRITLNPLSLYLSYFHCSASVISVISDKLQYETPGQSQMMTGVLGWCFRLFPETFILLYKMNEANSICGNFVCAAHAV